MLQESTFPAFSGMDMAGKPLGEPIEGGISRFPS
jgi:hypothetical protein